MARAFADLKVRRAALLLRCQQAREDRQRLLLLGAERAHAAAQADAKAARMSLRAQIARAQQARAAAHERLRGLVVGSGEIEALAGLEHNLVTESAVLAAELRVAEDRVARTSAEATDARAALQAQARATAKRSRLSGELAVRLRIEREAAEDAECDEQRVDMWAAF